MIEYIFQIKGRDSLHYHIDINREYSEGSDETNHPPWTKLDYCQCKNCPMPVEKYQYCPTAVDLKEIIDGFSTLISHDEVTVRVKTSEREYRKTCDVQTGLQAILGLIMATSACPILSKLRSLADFHLPFATTEDTIFRAVGAYLIQQYFIFFDGGHPDFELKELKNLYCRLEQLNASFTERIRAASKTDANLNAVVQLGALSFMVHLSLEEQLKDLRATFQKRLYTNLE
jgi:hypothetical protein